MRSQGLGDDSFVPQVVRRWAALSIGGGHAAGVSGSGECFAWGRNDCGQLGAPASAELQPVPARIGILRGWDVRAISCGCGPRPGEAARHAVQGTAWRGAAAGAGGGVELVGV